MRRLVSISLIILTLGLSAESLFSDEATSSCASSGAEVSLAEHATPAVSAAETHASTAESIHLEHACHIGHCSVVLVSEVTPAQPLQLQQAKRLPTHERFAFAHLGALLRPPSPLAA